MPIYQYRCRNCGADVEKMQSFTSDPLVECPECHQPTLKKVLQPAGIIFKGSGWYITDSKKSSSAVTPAGEKSDSSKSGDGAATSGSAESKPSESKPSESNPAETKAATAPAASTTPAASSSS
jgi:putative FmdB family regulatory protein